MLQQKDPQLRNDQPIIQVTKKVHASPEFPLRNQSEDSGEHLRGSGQTETRGTELIDTSLETKPRKWLRFRMDRNLEVLDFEVY